LDPVNGIFTEIIDRPQCVALLAFQFACFPAFFGGICGPQQKEQNQKEREPETKMLQHFLSPSIFKINHATGANVA